MKKQRLLITGLCLMATVGVAAPPHAAEKPAANRLPLEELRTFAEVFSRIKQDYVEAVDDKDLLQDAIQGMLSGLDPHSAYLNEKDFGRLREGTSGQFGGLGIEIGMEDGFVRVIAPIDDTPAQRAGIQAGDVIVRINQQSVKGMTLEEAVTQMRGKPGSRVTLQIVREGKDVPFTVELERAVIKTASVKQRMLTPGFAYVRLSHFQQSSAKDLLSGIEQLKKDADGSLQGLILDLRNNPGGVLGGAVAVSDAFLSEGTIVYTEGRARNSRLRFQAEPNDVLNGAPMVVLVDGGSASAAEIVAGALQDHKRAVVMGQQTFGKGSVQTVLPVNEHTAIKLTTARYYTPNGRSIQAEGIMPDIVLQQVTVAAAEKPELLKEANLSGHLTNPDSTETTTDKTASKKPLEQRDYALSQALNLLKGMAILQRKET